MQIKYYIPIFISDSRICKQNASVTVNKCEQNYKSEI